MLMREKGATNESQLKLRQSSAYTGVGVVQTEMSINRLVSNCRCNTKKLLPDLAQEEWSKDLNYIRSLKINIIFRLIPCQDKILWYEKQG